MDSRTLKAVAGLGIPGIALLVFFNLYQKFDWPLKNLPPTEVFWLALFFMAVVASVVVFSLFLYHPNRSRYDSALQVYERLRVGASRPTQNVSLIEELANSSDPNKSRYLQEIMDQGSLSFLEIDATKRALDSIRSGRRLEGVFEEITEKERSKLSSMMGATGDRMLDSIVVNLKYWRYLNRKTHPQYRDVEQAIANALAQCEVEQIVRTWQRIDKVE